MKKWFSLILAIVVFPLAAQTTLADRPVAVVQLHKTEVIPMSKFEQYIEVIKMQNGLADISMEDKIAILDVMINQILVKQDAAANNIIVTDEEVIDSALQQFSLELQQLGMIPQGAFLSDVNQMNEILNQQGMNPDLYLENTRNNLVIEKYIVNMHMDRFNNMGTPTESEIRNYYSSNIQLFAVPEYIKIRQVFFNLAQAPDPDAVRANARDIMRKIEAGQLSFIQALSEEGDLFPLNEDKTQALYIARGDGQTIQVMGQPFMDTLFEKTASTVPFMIESKVGFHIIMVDEHNDPAIRTLEDTISPVQTETVRDYVMQYLMIQRQQNLYAEVQQQVIIDLRERAGEEGIRVFEEAIR